MSNRLIIAATLTIAFCIPALADPGTTAPDRQSGMRSRTSPTWQQYMYAARETSGDKEKSAALNQASITSLSRALAKNPQLDIAPIEQSRARIMCVHSMCVEGSKIIDGPDGSKIDNAKELEKLVQAQTHDYQCMRNAHHLLKKISPEQAQSLAWELNKCSAHMAKTKANLDKLAAN